MGGGGKGWMGGGGEWLTKGSESANPLSSSQGHEVHVYRRRHRHPPGRFLFSSRPLSLPFTQAEEGEGAGSTKYSCVGGTFE